MIGEQRRAGNWRSTGLSSVFSRARRRECTHVDKVKGIPGVCRVNGPAVFLGCCKLVEYESESEDDIYDFEGVWPMDIARYMSAD